MQERKEHVNVIYPEEGKRYRLNVRSAVGRLTIGKVKQCLAAASSCPIPLSDMVLHLNGVPLSNDNDLCDSLGIGNGATLSVEARAPPQQQQQQSELEKSVSVRGHDSVVHGGPSSSSSAVASPLPPRFALSEQRRLLELQTLEQQDAMLNKDVVVRDDILRSTLHHVDDEMDAASLRRRQLERQRERADEELRRMQEREAAAAQERERLAALRTQEAARATERAAELAARREQLRAEQEATRAVSLLKLENEKKKATLAQQKALLEAERERALLEQDSFQASEKARELELRSREIDMEHQRLARIRDARALEADRRTSLRQRLHYYDRLGVEPPRALQREAAALLMGRSSEEDDNDLERGDDGTDEGEELGARRLSGRRPTAAFSTLAANQKNSVVKPSVKREAGTHRNGLVQSRGASHTPASPPSPAHYPNSVPPSSAASASPPQHKPHQRGRSPTSARAASTASTAPADAVAVVPDGGFYDARENAEANLRRLGDDLGLQEPLVFDDSDTCVISIDGEYTLLVTYDAATERLFLYSTLLAALPPIVQDSAEGRMKLYEFLLEASLLGREMCGGGVGASLRNNFVLMSASLYMPTSQPWSLRTLAPQFLHCLQHWRTKLTDFLSALESEGGAASGPAQQRSPSQTPVSTWSPQHQQQQQQQHHFSTGYSASPSRSHLGSSSPARSPYSSTAAAAAAAAAPRVLPVLGLEVTGTVLVNGMPTHYDNGVLVVNAAGPSVLAGIQPNDFVEELNGVPIRSVSDFRRVIAEQLVPGMVVPVRINRGGVAMVVTVRVEGAWSL